MGISLFPAVKRNAPLRRLLLSMNLRSGRRGARCPVPAPARHAGRLDALFRTTELLAALGLLVGCSDVLPKWGRRIEIEIIVADPVAPWDRLGALDHLIVLPTVRGDDTTSESRVVAGQGSLRLTIEKRTNLPILDYPLIAGRSDLLRPAGAVFPLDLEGRGRISTSYREGFLAELLVPVSATGELLEAVNVRRLRREIWERSSGDPWRLDRDAILQTLMFGAMRSDRIRARPCFDLSLEARAGTWVSGDPFYGPIVVGSEQPVLALRGLPSGAHRFFRVDDDMVERIDVEVTDSGWEWMDVLTGCGGSGRW